MRGNSRHFLFCSVARIKFKLGKSCFPSILHGFSRGFEVLLEFRNEVLQIFLAEVERTVKDND